MVALYVNNRTREHFAWLIGKGLKAIETRTKRAAKTFSGSGIKNGDRIAIVSGGYIVCYVTFCGLKEYRNAAEFYADFPLHLVDRNSKYRYDAKSGKVGLIFSDAVMADEAVKVQRGGNRTWTIC